MNRLGCGVLASVCEPFYGEPSREETRIRARRLDGVMWSEVGNLVQPSQKGGTMIKVNGKYYPLWSQFVEKKEKWIGGTLEDFGDSMDRYVGIEKVSTVIKNIKLVANGKDSAFFSIIGKDFNCGFDVKHGGISLEGKDGWLTFSGYGGHTFAIREG